MKNVIGLLLFSLGARLVALGMELITDKDIQKKLLDLIDEAYRESK